MFVTLGRWLKLRALRAARAGVAAVEFAVIAPIVVLVFFGLLELSEGVSCRERMENMASTAADLVAQTTQISNAGVQNVFNAANAIMYPYANVAKIKVSSIIADPNNSANGKVVWSDATTPADARAVGEIIPNMPTGVISTGGSVILAEVSYTYQSPLGTLLKDPITMSSKFYSRPRRSVTVGRTP
jgi:Flp pilus assembly protein TadG